MSASRRFETSPMSQMRPYRSFRCGTWKGSNSTRSTRARERPKRSFCDGRVVKSARGSQWPPRQPGRRSDARDEVQPEIGVSRPVARGVALRGGLSLDSSSPRFLCKSGLFRSWPNKTAREEVAHAETQPVRRCARQARLRCLRGVCRRRLHRHLDREASVRAMAAAWRRGGKPPAAREL
jgi:hypothetical protein